MKVVKFIDHVLNFIVFTFFVVAFAFSFYALYDVYSVYENTELSEDILKYKPSTQGENSFGNKFSLADLKKINSDIVGWVRVDDTNIDYPILAGNDNTAYLKTDYKGDYSPSGSIFLDYRNSRSLDDDYFVIYGHNMSKGLMFSDIKKFQDETFFFEHPTGKLYTEIGVYNLEILTFNIINANKDIAYKLQKYRNGNNQMITEHLMEEAIHKREIEVNESDSLILLSTCYGVGTYDRSVLLAKIVDSEDSEFIKDNSSEIQKQKEKAFEEKVIASNHKKNLVYRIFVFLIYIMIAGILYIRILLFHKKRKRKKRRKRK